MQDIIFIFPGQGSQKVGMGKALADSFPSVKHFFESLDDLLKENLSQIMFQGPETELSKTEYAQPALVALSVAIMSLFRQYGSGLSRIKYVTGHSLGEYSALAAAHFFQPEDAVRIVKKRGRLMQSACPIGEGGMVALMGFDHQDVNLLCAQASQQSGEICSIANENSPHQIVISGSLKALKVFETLYKGKRYIPLPVSAPFHSPFMEKIAQPFEEEIKKFPTFSLEIPFVSGVTAKEEKGENIIPLLVSQLYKKIRWVDTVQYIVQHSENPLFFEIGSGNVLSGLIKKISPQTPCFSVSDPEGLTYLIEKTSTI